MKTPMEQINPSGILKPIIEASQARFKVEDGDYLDEEGLYVCGKCGKRKQTYITIPDRPGKIVVGCSCDCAIKRMKDEEEEFRRKEEMRQIQILKDAGVISKGIDDWKFENFETDKWNELNLKYCKRYATAFDEMLEKNQGLLMFGDVGTGKSYAAGCIYNYLLEKNVPAIMVSIPELIQYISGSAESESSIINRINRAKLVVYDDLGAERQTEYAAERVYNIIDSRIRKMLPMIITTNYTMDEIKNTTDTRYRRIFSRISKNCYPMQFSGPDRRKVEASKRFKNMWN